MKKKVVVGMSGGVDSSVAAYLLKQQGYEVIGVTMQVWQEEGGQEKEENGGCCGNSAVEDARRVAQTLDIPYYVMNFRQEFKENVIDYFVREYLCGRTPNPCIACNRHVKWESLLNKSLALGADYIATGHYAKVVKLENGRFTLMMAASAAKDQTYALYNLTQYQLAHTLMPVGEYTKEEIRKIAASMNLLVADKPDSQEICFIPDHNYADFIRGICGNETAQPGNFIDQEGRVLGTHKGIIHYTIGQRKGLNLSMGHPVFVTKILPYTNEVVIGEAEDVFTKEAYCENIHYMAINQLDGIRKVTAKIRYSHKGAKCFVEQIAADRIKCTFTEPVRAVTPGQAIVFYENNKILGGGTITV